MMRRGPIFYLKRCVFLFLALTKQNVEMAASILNGITKNVAEIYKIVTTLNMPLNVRVELFMSVTTFPVPVKTEKRTNN